MKALVVSTAIFLSFTFLASNSCFASQNYLADRHQAKGIKCEACHTATPPTAANASKDNCLKCHGGSYAELAKKTDGGDLNFHDTHLGEISCMDCHHGHKASTLICDQCHEFKAKVP